MVGCLVCVLYFERVCAGQEGGRVAVGGDGGGGLGRCALLVV